MTPEDIKKAREIIAAAPEQTIKWFYFKALAGWPEALDEAERLQNELNYWTHGGIVKSELEKLRTELEDAKDIITSRGVVIEELKAEIARLQTKYLKMVYTLDTAPHLDELCKLRAVAEAADRVKEWLPDLEPVHGTPRDTDHNKAAWELREALKAWQGKK